MYLIILILQTTAAKDVSVEDKKEEVNSKTAAPSQANEDCPTVVVTSITAGDTPTSDDDMELKEKEEPPKETEASENTYRSADEFECTFPETDSEVASQQVPSSSETVVEFGQKREEKAPESETFAESEKMEVNGVDTSKNFFSSSQNAETTG